jgi:hypothetical protein
MMPEAFYSTQSPVSDPGQYAYLFDNLPRDIAGITKVAQGLVYHYTTGEYTYGYRPPKERLSEIDTRYMEAMLGRIIRMDDRPLTEARAYEDRLVGCCRDFSLLACAILRHQGTPARLRHGFGGYFTPGYWGDHVVVEYWNGTRWQRFDAQMPPREAFDMLDMPKAPYATGGRAWQMIRNEGADPSRFGLGPDMLDVSGEWFVRQRLLQDCSALNKQEMLCWDQWKLGESIEPVTGEDAALFDQLAALSVQPDSSALRDFYGNEPRLNLSQTITCFSPAVGPHPVTLNW